MTANEYKIKKEELLTEYEDAVRKWLSEDYKRPGGRKIYKGDPEFAQKIPFYRDGVVCPEVWFEKGNNFRPLIILKEVSMGKEKNCEINDYLNEWGGKKRFEFVENPFDDVRIGTFSQWRRIARLVRSLEAVYNGETDFDYTKCDLSFEHSGECYSGNIDGYKDKKNYYERTGNKEYRRITDRMAVIEIKKIGAGTDVKSEISLAGRPYTDHIEPFKGLIKKQIELINPTVIICCGREYSNCISELLKEVRSETENSIAWIDGYHHILSSDEKFFDEPISEFSKDLNK